MLACRGGEELGITNQGIHSQPPQAVATDQETGMPSRTPFDVFDSPFVPGQILRHRFQVAVDFARERRCTNTESAPKLFGGDGGQVTLGLPRHRGMTRASDEQAQLAGVVGSALSGIDRAAPLDAENG